VLGVLSSRVHQVWARCAGGTLEDRPRWNNTLCFLKFPFPGRSEAVAEVAEALDAYRKGWQRAEPRWRGRMSTTRWSGASRCCELHARLDRAVFAAYGWPCDLADEEVLVRLVELNARRAGASTAMQAREAADQRG
jgi:hypothetical protein